MYSNLKSGVNINNVIILFYHYLQANPNLYAMYIDTSSYFSSQKLCINFHKKDITVIFTPSISQKSVGMIQKSNNIFQ